MRILRSARLSRLRDDSHGIDDQDQQVEQWATAYGHDIVADAIDTDISGDTDPFTRPELGPWLTEPIKIAKYDAIAARHLDRLGRSSRYLTKLREWAEDQDKQIIVMEPSLKWPVEANDIGSKIMWEILGIMAEYELTMIKHRIHNSRVRLVNQGVLVGRPPFAYRVVADGKFKTIEPDAALAPYVRVMADMYLAGSSLADICRYLDEHDVPTDQGGIWDPKTVSRILRNPIYGLGIRKQSYHDKNKVKKTVTLQTTPILDEGIYRKVQAKIEANPRKRGAVSDPAYLTDIIHCARCKGIMHRRNSVTKRKDGSKYVYEVYRCDGTARKPSRCKNTVKRDDIEAWTDLWFTGEAFGNTELVERETKPGHGHEDEIASVDLELQSLDQDAEDYDEMHAALRAERKRLQNLPVVPSEVIDTPTGVYMRDYWPKLTPQEKREHLKSAEVIVYAARDDRWITGPHPHIVAGKLVDVSAR